MNNHRAQWNYKTPSNHNTNIKGKLQRGFTIIEVIIVLVIAAIIMLIVFLVVPQLQRTQRNSRRQSDARRVLAAAEQFAANSSGVAASCTTSLAVANCTNITTITGTVLAPSGAAYTVVTSLAPAADAMSVSNNINICTGSTPSASATNKFTVIVHQETATGSAAWCVSN